MSLHLAYKNNHDEIISTQFIILLLFTSPNSIVLFHISWISQICVISWNYVNNIEEL
jgi:hypothetical protein